MYNYLFIRVLATAYSVGMDANNPEGGLHHDSSDGIIIETVCDIARADDARINQDDLTERQEHETVQAFLSMVKPD